jgi:hypothetical protein
VKLSLRERWRTRLFGAREHRKDARIRAQRSTAPGLNTNATEVEIVDYHQESTTMAKKLKPMHPGEVLREGF